MNNNKLKNNYKNKTKLILSGMDKSNKNSFVNPPIEKGSTVTFNSVEEMNKTMIQKHNQILSYGRFGSKTTFKFEKAILVCIQFCHVHVYIIQCMFDFDNSLSWIV